MTVRRAALLGAILGSLAIGCGEKGGGAPGTTTAVGATAGSGGGSDTAGITDEALKKFALTDIDGFERIQMNPEPMMGTVAAMHNSKDKNANGVGSQVRVQIGRCAGELCLPIDKAAWEAKKATLPHTMMWSEAVKTDPNLVHEISEMDLDGKKVIAAYIFSHVVKESESGTSRTGSHTLNVYYNNGTNFAWLSVYPWGAGGLAETAELYKSRFTKDELVAVAKKVLPAAVQPL